LFGLGQDGRGLAQCNQVVVLVENQGVEVVQRPGPRREG
jgi:hypothetical protein